MAFTVDDYADLLRLLDDNPEWRESLRRRVLDEEFMALPALVRQNSVDIAANTAAIDRLEQVVRQNTVDIAKNTAAIDRLEEAVRQNTVDIASNTAAIDRLERAVARLEVTVEKLVRSQAQIFGRLGSAEGQLAEWRWYRGFDGRFSSLVRKARVVTTRELSLFDRADEEDLITEAEARAVRALDLIIEGVQGKKEAARPVLLAIAISNRIEADDVTRARDRAAILRKVGYNAVPVVAGSLIEESLMDLARGQGIEVLVRPDDIARPAEADFDF